MKRLFAIPMLAGLLAACATTHDKGWQGSGAKPFDTAKAGCESESLAQPAGDLRTQAFETCMATQGWHRP
jgi:hypothetical protein